MTGISMPPRPLEVTGRQGSRLLAPDALIPYTHPPSTM